MRIALNATGEVGIRAGRILLGERDLTALGIYGPAPEGTGSDRRAMRIRSLDGFDLLISDDPAPAALAAIAAEDGVGFVTPTELGDAGAAGFDELPVVTGAGLRALASALASHEAARVEEVHSLDAAWTVDGKPLRRGSGVGFPDPLGPRWGRAVPGGVEVPLTGIWAGATATVRGTTDGVEVERIVGVSDHRTHLEAIVLAAATIAAAEGAYPPGPSRAEDASEALLAAALRVGLGVAAFTSEGS